MGDGRHTKMSCMLRKFRVGLLREVLSFRPHPFSLHSELHLISLLPPLGHCKFYSCIQTKEERIFQRFCSLYFSKLWNNSIKREKLLLFLNVIISIQRMTLGFYALCINPETIRSSQFLWQRTGIYNFISHSFIFFCIDIVWMWYIQGMTMRSKLDISTPRLCLILLFLVLESQVDIKLSFPPPLSYHLSIWFLDNCLPLWLRCSKRTSPLICGF